MPYFFRVTVAFILNECVTFNYKTYVIFMYHYTSILWHVDLLLGKGRETISIRQLLGNGP
jgi:hypothetical protein